MSNEPKVKDGRGGSRGGGRPKKEDAKKKVQVSLSLSPEIVSAVKASSPSPSKFIEQLLREHFGL